MSFRNVSDSAFTPVRGCSAEACGIGMVSLSTWLLRGCSCSSHRQEYRDERKEDRMYTAAREPFQRTPYAARQISTSGGQLSQAKGPSFLPTTWCCASSFGWAMSTNAIVS